MIKYNSVIKYPIVTEKSSFLREKFNRYSLYVSVNVNKYKIRLTIESLFGAKVSSLNVIRVKPKRSCFKGIIGYEKRRKKVYFSLMNHQKLDIMGGV
ncbi:MAG: 50S ribosomal protein L23 [Wolbachia endosymbiont of Menacanthus eurysternus]|nr:MAG: 50S ribosomal protein L23 [Wolbachia endosymbiont of Menacanthus eurysternus]